MTIYPLEFQRRADEKWARAQVPRASEARQRLLGLFGRAGREDLVATDGKRFAEFGWGTRPDFCTARRDAARIGDNSKIGVRSRRMSRSEERRRSFASVLRRR